MKTFYFLFIPLIFLSSCEKNKKLVNVWIENDSNINNRIEFSTFLNDSLIDKRIIERDSVADRISTFKVELKLKDVKEQWKFRVVASVNGQETVCKVYADSINKVALLHVNYVERVIRKGNIIYQDTLKYDSIVQKQFYCEVMY